MLNDRPFYFRDPVRSKCCHLFINKCPFLTTSILNETCHQTSPESCLPGYYHLTLHVYFLLHTWQEKKPVPGQSQKKTSEYISPQVSPGLLSGSVGKESACNAGDVDPWVGKILWRRAWQPTPAFLPGESHGQRRLAGYSPWGHKESGMTEHSTKKCSQGQKPIPGRLRSPPNLDYGPPYRWGSTIVSLVY